MVYNREGYAPWSLTRKAGVQSATVDGDIEVPQYIQPILDTGFVDDKGDWKGRTSSDEQFRAFGKDEAIANTGVILVPQTATSGTIWPLDMTGYSELFIAILPTRAGTYAIEAVMGPDSESFANLRPVNAATILRGNGDAASGGVMEPLLSDSESLTADVWNIFYIQYGRLANQKLLQIKITNNSGGEADIETAFMRLV